MFLIKSISSLVWGNGNTELIQIQTGSLYQLTPDGKPNLIIQNCSATVRKTTEKFNYHLVLRDEDNPDEEEELLYLIDEEIIFHPRRNEKGNAIFAWRDSNNQWFMFQPEGITESTMKMFELTVLGAIYERKHKEPSENLSESQLIQLRGDPSKASSSPTPSKPQSTSAPTTASSPSTSPKSTPSTSQKTVFYPKLSAPLNETSLSPVFSSLVRLYYFNSAEKAFELLGEKMKATIFKKNGTFTYYFSVVDQNRTYTAQEISSGMNSMFFYKKDLTMSYSTTIEGSIYGWGIKVSDPEEERKFVQKFGYCMVESQREESMDDLADPDRRALLSTFDDVEMDDSQIDSSDEEEEEKNAPQFTRTPAKSKEKNSSLNVGYKYDRSFVVRGNQVSVFGHEPDSLKYVTTIENLKTPEGREFSPMKTMLHKQDSSMLLLDPKNKGNLYKLDLTVGKVVEEWKVDENNDIEDFCPQTKLAPTQAVDTLVGMGHNSLYLIDPRLSGCKQVKEQMKQYARSSKNEFSCGATTESGEMVVASKKGEFRLYNQLNKQAKTHLPGMGDPIIGVDVTTDSKFILATCKTYLIVIKTEIDESNTGFTKSMGQKKPVPKKLQLKPEHIAEMGCQPSFTPAKFNTGEDQETTIVTSSGPYVITWNFRRVREGHLYDYRIKKYADTVVADNFRYGQHKSIVVALPEDVTMVNKKNLKTPQKSGLRNEIVNSPF